MTKTQMKAIDNIIAQTAYKEFLQGVWTGENGNTYCVCPFYGVMLYEPIPEIQKCKGDPSIESLFDIPAKCDSLTPPTIAQLKTHVKGYRRGGCYKPSEVAWDFGPEKPWVNPWYLMDILTIFPGASLYYLTERKSLSFIYFEHANGKGLLLPIRKTKI